MRAAFYVPQIRQQVDAFRLRISKYGEQWNDLSWTDIETIAIGYLGCRVVSLPYLTDRKAVEHLRECYRVDGGEQEPADEPLAGALYYSVETGSSWIYVEETDIPTRKRFTLAHEVGHFVNEAEPLIRRNSIRPESQQPLLRFSRCSSHALDVVGEPTRTAATQALVRKKWSPGDLREIEANRFAAEVLMPYRGLRQLIAQHVGAEGIQSQKEMDDLIVLVSSTFRVSRACAERRVLKDLRIRLTSSEGSLDLFAR